MSHSIIISAIIVCADAVPSQLQESQHRHVQHLCMCACLCVFACSFWMHVCMHTKLGYNTLQNKYRTGDTHNIRTHKNSKANNNTPPFVFWLPPSPSSWLCQMTLSLFSAHHVGAARKKWKGGQATAEHVSEHCRPAHLAHSMLRRWRPIRWQIRLEIMTVLRKTGGRDRRTDWGNSHAERYASARAEAQTNTIITSMSLQKWEQKRAYTKREPASAVEREHDTIQWCPKIFQVRNSHDSQVISNTATHDY